ncbi:MAG: D-tyrosyl-tRNA(Tyr) deacylase, partial [Actinobacteria bacterium]|nr:D-tyrosyl-tRNA(Tyr) deacylase [Actinomycetota bacterium]NIV54441.1 D-tyrosyl-tRNA(Tyr) deacylase [Actinomycetota bacterium]NIV85759.1 D-tyrosyl-tRNA(Tyr) deacylase [Actinomycetota bacterium]
MRVLLQRVSRAEVRVDGAVVGRIGPGLLVLLGVEHDDTPEAADWYADKTAELRIFADDAGKMNRSVEDV